MIAFGSLIYLTLASPINIRDLEDTISNHRRLQDSHINAANSILKNHISDHSYNYLAIYALQFMMFYALKFDL